MVSRTKGVVELLGHAIADLDLGRIKPYAEPDSLPGAC